ncbi:DNA-binding protein [bacterium]|nr:MAG: DNA-binding protein [bacterium]RLE26196.1 MAG: DNA-binding protein [Acidobacteriota bacterium]
MARPHKKRTVHRPPVHVGFKPTGVQSRFLETLPLALDELEAIRLADYMGMDHADSAEEMDISRSTFSRLVERARRKVAEFLIEGRHLQVDGGEIHFQQNRVLCDDCGHLLTTGFGPGPTKCPSCGSTNLIDLAGGFGHGPCCRRHHNNRRR